MRISGIDFPKPLLDAFRNDRLVVFAGAGVSMGLPAGLPNFRDLTRAIAQGTGEMVPGWKEDPSFREDSFLGRLSDQGVDVHGRAAQELLKGDPKPTGLHRDLLRLHREPASVRIVTTNFDLLFERAAKEMFPCGSPEVFRAPALPSGRNFDGIVHVHGALERPGEMVLTDKDFGQAYITEGWAQRFLVDLFRSFSVLFIGYSHNDVVMTYLARALVSEGAQPRFALDDSSDAPWKFLGIEAIAYPNPGNGHHALHEGIAGLAEVVTRGSVAWQREIGEIAQRPPSLNEEELDLIDDALSDATRTRYFTDAATDPEWIDWLHRRGYLDCLFTDSELSEPQRLVAWWLARTFALRHADRLFHLIGQHGVRLHPRLWFYLGHSVGAEKNESLSHELLAQWVSMLLQTAAPATGPNADFAVLSWLGERCMERDLLDSLTDIFDALSEFRLDESLEPILVSDHYELNEVWENGLKPNLDMLGGPLLELLVEKFRKRHRILSTWGGGDSQWDPATLHRSAIHPDDHDQFPTALDVLIDTARDCLEHLALNQPGLVASWCDRLIVSEAPLLRRLAVHTLSVRDDLSADEKIHWLLAGIGLHDVAVRSELSRVLQLTYPYAGEDLRSEVVRSVLDYTWPVEDDEDRERLTARSHFRWLRLLRRHAPKCAIAEEALDGILARYPEFQPGEHSDSEPPFVSSGFISPTSPWIVEELLSRPASEWLDVLLSFRGEDLFGPDREGLSVKTSEAALQNFSWGLDLADALIGGGHWDSDLWPSLIRVWSRELDQDMHRRVLNRLSHTQLYAAHVRPIADALRSLVENGGMPYAPALLSEANSVAEALRDYLGQVRPLSGHPDRMFQAINDPAGVLAEYWLQSLAICLKQLDPGPYSISSEYRGALSSIIQDESLSGTLGKTILVSRLSFLLGADHDWTKEHLYPLFEGHGNQYDYTAVWHGFLYGGSLSPPVAELMQKAFLGAVSRMESTFPNEELRRKFIGRYVTMLVYAIDSPLEEWIPEFFEFATLGDRRSFALAIGSSLQNMNDVYQKELWANWLKSYWENRLQGVPASLDPAEIEAMLDWMPQLSSLFPEAVELALRIPGSSVGSHLLLHRIAKSNVWKNYPEAAAMFLIHLGHSAEPSEAGKWSLAKDVVDGLFQMDLSQELRIELKELAARVGLT